MVAALPPGATAVTLSGVSCTAVDACTAVGSYVNSAEATVTLAESWNGTAWRILATPNPAGSTDSVLQDVSCTSAGACTAVGYYVNSVTDTVTLAESWNGTTWTIRATPNPASSPDNELLGVSCTSPRTCMAVGYFIADRGAGTLAESWNGTAWAIQATPNVAGAHNNYLSAVSCTGASACTAVGAHDAIGQPELPLAESWDGALRRIRPTPGPAGPLSATCQGSRARPPTAAPRSAPTSPRP